MDSYAADRVSTPLRRRPRRRYRGPGSYQHRRHRRLPPSPLRKSLGVNDEGDLGSDAAAASSHSDWLNVNAPRRQKYDWRELQDPAGNVFWLNVQTGVCTWQKPKDLKKRSSHSKKSSRTNSKNKSSHIVR